MLPSTFTALSSFFRLVNSPKYNKIKKLSVTRSIVVLSSLVGLLVVVVPTLPAHAASFTVNSLADTPDATINGICDDGTGKCTLRAAIQEANNSPAPNYIDLTRVTGTINLGSALPAISVDTGFYGPGTAKLTITRIVTTQFRILQLNSGVTVTLMGVTITNGSLNNANGSGILNNGNLTINNVNFLANVPTGTVNNGGGIYNTGTLNVTNAVFDGNSGSVSGGGIYNATGGTTTVTNTTFSNNKSTGGIGGGGIYNDTGSNLTVSNSSFINGSGSGGAGIYNRGTAKITNSTFTSGYSSDGAGIYNWGGLLDINNSTFAYNQVLVAGASIANNGGTVKLSNTIVANTTLSPSGTAADVSGSFTSLGYNLIANSGTSSGFTNGVNGDIVGSSANPVNPKLAALGNYGWQAQTVPPMAGSPALNAGNPAIPHGSGSNCEIADQRGNTRPTNSCTIGAVEPQPLIIAPAVLPNPTLNTVYNQPFSGAGGSGTGYNFSVTAGSLPTGLTLSSSGVLSGTPSGNSGNYNFTIGLTDSFGNTTGKTYTLLLSPAGSIEFASPTVAVNEKDGVATFTVNRIGNADRAVSARVNLGANGDTASPADYVYQPGSLDTSFSSVLSVATSLRAIVLQNDGKIILGGWEIKLKDGTTRKLLRLNTDGSLDTSFTNDTPGEQVKALAKQTDGKIIVGGSFSNLGGQARSNIARLNADGTLDSAFNPVVNGRIEAIAIQPDGKIIIGGKFITVNNVTVSHVVRLNEDGSLDSTINPNFDNEVGYLALQRDGKLLVSGAFKKVSNQERVSPVRLNADFSLDTSFNPAISSTGVLVQADDKIIIGSGYTVVNPQFVNNPVCLNLDGSIDATFNFAPFHNAITSLVFQPDGKLLVGGSSAQNPLSEYELARFNTDRSLDSDFSKNIIAFIDNLTMQPDGKIIAIGQSLYQLNPQRRLDIARLNNDIFLNWAAGDTAPKTFSLPIVKDGIAEPNETLTLTLNVLSSGTNLGTNKSTVLTIVDNSSITINPASLPTGTVGTAYNQTLTASGGSDNGFNFSVSQGNLPPGLTLTPNGLLSGTPSGNGGTFNFTVTATDSANNTGTKAYSLVINRATQPPAITIAPTTLPSGTVGTAYNQTLTASGGSGTGFSFTVTAGNLPPGLTLTTNGVLNGTPTGNGGTFNFSVTATDSANNTGSKAYSLLINRATQPPAITIAPATLPSGTVGTAYNQNLTASGGTNPYNFELTTGSLPNGIALATSGQISGTPKETGTFSFTVKATDANNLTATQTFSLAINPAPQPAFSSNPASGETITLRRVPIKTTATTTLTISNTGTANLTLSTPTGLAAPFGLSNTSSLSIAPNTSQTLSVSCNPSKIGKYNATLSYSTNDPNQVTISYKLVCTARPPKLASLFKSLTPARLYDSRPGSKAALGGDGAITLGQIRTFTASGKLGIPTTATAILANITVTGAEGGGYVTAFPADADSDTATVNWYGSGARTVGNFALIGLDSQGQFKLKGGGKTEVIIDVVGYLEEDTEEGGIVKALPSGTNPRLYDSRPSSASSGLLGSGDGKLLAGQTRTITVAGQSSPQNIPASATAVLVNLTAVATNKGGFITLYPAGGAVPNVASVNWNDKLNASYPNIPATVGNFAVVPISPDGKLSMVAGGNAADSGADVVIDVLGYIDSAEGTDSSFYSPLLAPSRLYDSRDRSGTYQKASSESGALAAGATRTVKAAGLAGVPAGAKRVVVRITTVDTAGAGFLALYPGAVWPKNASVNTSKAGQVIGNLVVVELENGSFTVYNGGTASCGFVLDVVGYIL